MSDLLNVYLPKWPGLLVAGEPVTQDQAAEIIIRTTRIGSLFSNDKRWLKVVDEAFGIPPEDWDADFEYNNQRQNKIEEARERLGIIQVKDEDFSQDLEFLNNHQILSCFIGGPHGWCDWDGNIYTSSYNIGKWPSVQEVKSEWEAIAAAFPFLKLRCQLLSGETCEEGTRPVVEFQVENGEVFLAEPAGLLQKPQPADLSGILSVVTRLGEMDRERGTTEEYLKQAISITENRG